MKFTIPQKELIAALKKAKPVVTLKSVVPCLTCGLLEAKGDTLSITGSNGDQRITVTTKASVKEEGASLIPFERLFNLIDRLSGEVTISTDEKAQAFIVAGNDKSRLFGLSADIYPPESEVGKPLDKFKDQSGIISRALNKVKAAISVNLTRPIINSVNFGAVDGKLAIVATTGSSMHLVTTELKSKTSVIIPTDAVSSLAELFPESVEYEVYENRIIAKGEGVSFMSKLIEGNFPNFAQIIPKESPPLVFEREEILRALNVISSTLDMDGKVKIESTKKGVTISSTVHETGETSSYIEGKQKLETTVVLSKQYLRDAIMATDEDEIKFEAGNGMDACALREGDFLAVISPMRTAATAK